MRKKLSHNKTVFLVAALCAIAWSTSARANTVLDMQLRSQLDRMFFPEQYILDIRSAQKNEPGTVTGTAQNSLPGLAFPGNPSASASPDSLVGLPGKVDPDEALEVMLVVDKSVSRERMRIAEELVKHIAQSYKNPDRLTLKITQQDILKTMPDALKQNLMPPTPAPQQPQAQPTPKNDKPEEKEPPKHALEILMENKDFALRALIVVWAALASLLGVFAILRNLTAKNSDSNITLQNKSLRDGTSTGLTQGETGGSAATGGAAKASGTALRRAATRDELYSKDEAAAKMNAEIVKEASEFPVKAARILSRWVESSTENARYANMFLKNCDVKTIESICSHMHPADIESIMSNKIDGFDPFGDENARVMELMRNEIALMAATQSVEEKSDPLEFARILSEDDLTLLLRDEDPVSIAAVVAQLRPHRVASLFKQIGSEKFALVMQVFASGDDSLKIDFDSLRERLMQKAAGIYGNQFNVKNRTLTVMQMIDAISNPSTQRDAVFKLFEFDQDMFNKVRENTILPDDFEHMTVKTIRTITQNIEADTLGAAFCGLDIPLDGFLKNLPEGYRIAFDETRGRDLPSHNVENAWRETLSQIRKLQGNGFITQGELNVGKRVTDSQLRNPVVSNKNVA